MTADAWQALPDGKRKKHMSRFTKRIRDANLLVSRGWEGKSFGKRPKRQREKTRTKVKKGSKDKHTQKELTENVAKVPLCLVRESYG
ncbi:voltage-dependent calcium channel gamma subunit [Plakobranchus ocellatus]|uniref:Voltage-dependent calcium channel gamma subunit n=1 Tax=Plakobranchus ocellatus TaxID=259542 RepID=A0AAV4AKA2_9GAST|nr:voltage-dependent calcium channel gamma subunit [Plakobranchus ocellatus]